MEAVTSESKDESSTSAEEQKPVEGDPPSQTPDEPMTDVVAPENLQNESSEVSQSEDTICTKNYRAKLYRLTEDGGWDDLGTGNS